MDCVVLKGAIIREKGVDIPGDLSSMLEGGHGPTKQKAARLVVDLASTAGAVEFVRVERSPARQETTRPIVQAEGQRGKPL